MEVVKDKEVEMEMAVNMEKKCEIVPKVETNYIKKAKIQTETKKEVEKDVEKDESMEEVRKMEKKRKTESKTEIEINIKKAKIQVEIEEEMEDPAEKEKENTVKNKIEKQVESKNEMDISPEKDVEKYKLVEKDEIIEEMGNMEKKSKIESKTEMENNIKRKTEVQVEKNEEMEDTAEVDMEKYYLVEKDEIIAGVKVPSIVEDYVEDFPSFVDRFFTRHYFIKPKCLREDYVVLFHSNRVCLICLAPNHIALEKGIERISFDVGNCDRSLNQVKGKGKKGGMILQEDSILAMIYCKDQSTYKIPSCVRGKLIEVNPRIMENPELLSKEGDGYMAIILPKIDNCDKIKEYLLSEEQYKAKLNEKPLNG